MRNKTLHILILVVSLILLLLTLIISPYKYEWESELKQISDNSVLVLRLFYIGLTCLNVMGLIISIRRKEKIQYLYIIILLFVTYKFVKNIFFIN
jgi:hypothetical protein